MESVITRRLRVSRIARVTKVNLRRMMTSTVLAAGLLAVVGAGVWSAFSAAPVIAATGINHEINFQGKIVNTDGTNVTNGTYAFTFKLYSVSSGGAAVWTETKSLTVTDGIFQTQLGDTTSLPGSVNFNTDSIYLGINFNPGSGYDGEMSPRIQFTAAAYAFNSDALGGIGAAGFAQINPSSAQSGSLNIGTTVQAGTSLQAPLVDTATATQLNIGTGTATSVVVGRATSTTATTIQGSNSSTWTATGASGTTTINFTAPTANSTYNFGASTAGTYTICTTYAASCSAVYQAYSAGGYIAKNANDTSTASFLGNLLGLSNTNTGAAGVLGLTNAGTNSALSVTQSGNPTSGQALILANDTAGTPTGNLIDLQVAAASKFSVSTAGAVTTAGTINGQTISSTASFTGTVTAATSVNAPLFYTTDTAAASTNSSGLTVRSGNATGTGTSTSGNIVINTGNGTAGSGNVSIDAGTGTTTGAINIGTGNASAVTIGKSATLTTVNGSFLAGSIQDNGALTFNGTVTTNYTSPLGTSIPTKINIPNYDPGAFGQILALGLPSTANATARAITLLDARTVSHQPTIGVLSPDESQIFGLSWDGSNTTALLKDSGNSIALQAGGVNVLTASNASGVGAVSVSGTLAVTTSVSSPLFNTADTAVASTNSAAVTFRSGNATGTGTSTSGAVTIGSGNGTAGSGNVSIDSGTGTTKGSVSVGTGNASAVNVGRTGASLSIQGSSASTIVASTGTFATTIGFTTPTANSTYNFGASTAGSYTICTTFATSCSSIYQAAGSYIAKNAVDTSSATLTAGQTLLTLSNGAGNGSSVLQVNNGTATNSALYVTAAANPSAGQALIQVNNTAGTPSGNLIDLQNNGTSKFAVTAAGAVTTGSTINSQTISAAASFTGTVTAATGLTVSGGGINVTGGSNIAGSLGGITGLTVASGGAAITGTSTVSGTLGVNNTVSLTGTGANELSVSGAPSAVATAGLVQVGTGFAGGNNLTSGGTYLALNAPNSGNGSAADFLNFEYNGTSKVLIANTGAITAGTYNSQTLGAASAFTGTVSAVTGYKVNGGATTGTFLRGDGTNYVSNTIQATDIPAGSTNYIQNGSSTQTGTANFNISGSGTVGGSLTSPSFTGTGAVSVTSGGAGALTLGSGSGTLSLTNGTNTVQRIASGTTTLDLDDAANTLLLIKNSGSGVANLDLYGGDLQTGTTPVSRITNAGNLVNIGTITATGAVTGGTYNSQTISSAASFTGTVTSASTITATSGGVNVTGGIVNNGGGITGAGAITGATQLNSTDTTAGSTNSSALALRSGNATGASSSSGAVTLDSGTHGTGGTSGAVNVGTGNASSVGVGNTSAALTLQGSQTSSLVVGNGTNTTTVNFANPTANVTYQLQTATAGSYNICTSVAASCSAVYQAAGAYIAKNAVDTSSATLTAGQTLYTFSNNAGNGSSVLQLNNGSATNSTLYVTAGANPSAGQALIQVNNTTTTPSGNLVDFQVAGTSKFSVNYLGNATTGLINGQTISSAASFTGTVTSANTISTTSGGLNITGTGTFNNAVNVAGVFSANGGASISTGLNNNSGGITNAGAVSGLTSLSYNTNGTLDATTGNTVSIGTSTASAVTVGRAAGNLTLQGGASTSLVANNGGSTSTVSFGTPTANVIYQFPTATAGTYQICSTYVSTCGTTYAAYYAAGYIQLAPTTPQPDSSANTSIYINKTSGTQLVNLQATGSTVFAVQTNGTVYAGGSSASALMTVDTTNFRVKIGTGTPTQAAGTSNANGGLYVSGTLETSGLTLLGDATNNASFSASTHEVTFNGNARHLKAIHLLAEYPGAVLDSNGSGTVTGTMTAAIDSSTSPDTSYYKWTTNQATNQNYDIVVNVPVPEDWGAWSGNMSLKSYVNTAGSITATVTETNGTTTDPNFNATTITSGTGSWFTYSAALASGAAYTSGGTMTIRLHMTTLNSDDVRMADITIPYLSKW